MGQLIKILWQNCLIFRQPHYLLGTTLALLTVPGLGKAQKSTPRLSLQRLTYSPQYQTLTTPREISFYPPHSVEIIAPLPLTLPPSQQAIFMEELVKKQSPVLQKVKNTISSWQENEHFTQHWRLQNTTLYSSPSTTTKQKYLEKNLLRYAEKRLSGEIKQAQQGTTMHRVKVAQNSLRPQTKFQLAESYRLRFYAKVLRGQMFAKLENPYIKNASLKFKFFNRATFWERSSRTNKSTLLLHHSFGHNYFYSSQFEYSLHNAAWKWQLSRELEEIFSGLVAQVQAEHSSSQAAWQTHPFTATGQLRYDWKF